MTKVMAIMDEAIHVHNAAHGFYVLALTLTTSNYIFMKSQ